MNILEQLTLPGVWQDFLQYKHEKQHLSVTERKELESFIQENRFSDAIKLASPTFIPPLPEKKEINKDGVSKKRTVYSYPSDFNLLLKLIAFLLYRYDSLFAENCYAFRRNCGVSDAIKRIRSVKGLSAKYCLKVDISNYFNSIDIPLLLEQLSFLQKEDAALYTLFEKLLTADAVMENGTLIQEKRGAMAGTPISPFFANVCLMDTDRYFSENQVLYFRYSDDILLFANTLSELNDLKDILYRRLDALHLSLNPGKVHISLPGEPWEFLGFSYLNGQIDLSEHTLYKIKGKIRRKAHALRRWQQKKGLSGEKAAKGFIHAMNHKFYNDNDDNSFTWSRWFFPNLTTTKGLKEIDAYMQQYIRYTVTGRHSKSNYRIRYEKLKEWGYRSLVHEYYIQSASASTPAPRVQP